jgi:hypothetical protein
MIAGMSSKNRPRITRNNGIIPPFNGENDDQGRDFAAQFECGSKLEAEPVLKIGAVVLTIECSVGCRVDDGHFVS